MPSGIAHAVKIARDYLGDSPFALYLGDNFFMGGIRSFVDGFSANGVNCQMLLHPVPNADAFGIAEFENVRLTRIREKPVNSPSNLAVVAIYLFDRHVFEAVSQLHASARGELAVTDTIQLLIDDGPRVESDVLDPYWIDTGKMDDILEANRVILQILSPANEGHIDERSRVHEPVILQRRAQVHNSILGGLLIVREETQIVDSSIGPSTFLHHHCQLRDVRTGNSIVMEHTTIRGDSLAHRTEPTRPLRRTARRPVRRRQPQPHPGRPQPHRGTPRLHDEVYGRSSSVAAAAFSTAK
jgi:glucose-1-phosphate thymidylyltransferase